MVCLCALALGVSSARRERGEGGREGGRKPALRVRHPPPAALNAFHRAQQRPRGAQLTPPLPLHSPLRAARPHWPHWPPAAQQAPSPEASAIPCPTSHSPAKLRSLSAAQHSGTSPGRRIAAASALQRASLSSNATVYMGEEML